eukprot:Sdes_comp18796_c0_seq1m9205
MSTELKQLNPPNKLCGRNSSKNSPSPEISPPPHLPTCSAQKLFSPRDFSEIQVCQVDISPHDTLQGISIKYKTTVEILKHLNGIWKDDEIFGKSTILIPKNSPPPSSCFDPSHIQKDQNPTQSIHQQDENKLTNSENANFSSSHRLPLPSAPT